MKRTLVFLLILVLSLGLCACAQNTEEPAPAVSAAEYTFPAGTSVLGVDISGLTKDAAWTKVESAAAGYTLNLTVDGVGASVTANEIGLTCDKDVFMTDAERMSQGASAAFAHLVRFNEGKLRSWMHQHFNKAVTEGGIVYDETAKKYVMLPHADGQSSNPNKLVAAVREAICALNPSQELTGVSQILKPVRSAEDPAVKDALALANKMIGVKLSYTFSPNDEKITVDIPAETIHSFVTLAEDGFTPVINYTTLDAYVAELSSEYSVEGTSGDFRTTYGSYVGLTVSYNGHNVDSGSLAQDIVTCMQEGISETRTAPYYASGNRDMAYGGTYVEIDLSSQHLWFYKNGERLVSASIVSGKVAESWNTPTGVYSIYAKEAGAYLEGEDYRTFVNYWMPFYGGYGLHDATWRGSFGGTIYHYDGSHGCVNMPYDAASTVFNYASVGTKVILYGGTSSVPPLSQSLSGTTYYDVAEDAESFKLNITPYYSDPKITYKSSNPSVATVSSNGTVTIKGVGTASITVTAAAHKYYTSATTTVTINVHSACDEGRHKLGKPVIVKEPTCQSGLQKRSCTKCDYVEEETLGPTQKHKFSDDGWKIITDATCSEEGVKERTCITCGKEKETGVIPITKPHTEGDWETITAPTCVDKGSAERKCTVCGKSLETKELPPTGEHTPGDWEVKQDATCTEDGVKVKRCTHCDEELETGIIEAGHTPGEWVVNPSTCTQAGSEEQYCEECGELLDSHELSLAPHSFDGGGPTCDYCSEPNPNYIPPAPEETDPPEESDPTEESDPSE